MTTIAGRVRRMLLGLSPDEASFARRGFASGAPVVRARLERIGRTFVYGYNAAVELGHATNLGERVQQVPDELRGFAFEGAAMGLALLDCITPWRRDRVSTFLHADAAPHAYMGHVGAGWALARLRRNVGPVLSRFDPLLRWLLLDGYGFHEGYFSPHRWIERTESPAFDEPYAPRAFDQGLGRSIWFVACADAARVHAIVGRFAPHRQGDLWSGVGLACTYAGGATPTTLREIARAARSARPQLAQGAAFAAKTRERAGNEAAHTELACRILCGTSTRDAARATDDALVNLPGDAAEPAYEVWRRRIAEQFTDTSTTRVHTARMAQ